jgi:hypothetical protein
MRERRKEYMRLFNHFTRNHHNKAIVYFLYCLCRALNGASFETEIKILLFSQVEIYAKQKCLPNIFIMRGQSSTTEVVHIELGKTIRNS